MLFDSTYRYFAFDASLLANTEEIREQLGHLESTAPDHKGEMVKTLLCGKDNKQTGKLRAGILNETVVPIHLTDGRLCLGGYWSIPAKDAFESGEIAGAELTVDQIKSLTPTEGI